MRKHYRENRNKNKIRKAIIKLVAISIILFGGNYAIDTVRAMSETEFWGMFQGQPMVFENTHRFVPTVEAKAMPVEEPKPVFDKVAKVTAYNSVPEQTDSTPCIGAANKDICVWDGCVVAQNGVKMGTKVEIEGIGICTVLDRKNSRYDSNWIDLYMGGRDMVDEALEFGEKTLKYRVIN